jgi:hypothetical protein
MSNKLCPSCNTRYGDTAHYCRACGRELIKLDGGNCCSENKGDLCRTLKFSDDDVYCECCGSLTTYAAERVKNSAPASAIKTIPVY